MEYKRENEKYFIKLEKGEEVIDAIFGDSEYKTFGGHLSKAVVGITAEIEIRKTEHVLNRKPDSTFGLNYWSL